ncbi:MAG: flagellar motor switch protein FliG [Treponema sp.]|jgi:flagellar motor switch protein FliG|nr:flagellar motor switch protein FliG [Treponema sp.]
MENILRRGIDAYRQTMRQPRTETQAKTVSGPPSKPAGLFKTVKAPELKNKLMVPEPGSILPPVESGSGDSANSKYRRVAQLLILTGVDEAASVLAELDLEQVVAIAREIASIRGISAEEGAEILAEFRSMFLFPGGYSGSSSGGLDAARRILYAAYGPEKGEALLNKTLPESKENAFVFLEEYQASQIVFLLKGESPSAAALVLARLPPKLSAETISKFPAERKPDILKRIARQGQVAPEVLDLVAAGIKEKARHFSGGSSGGGREAALEIDGMQTLAAILKQGDYAFGDRIIGELEADNPGIGKDLKEKLYTLDDVIAAVDRPLQEKLKTMTDREIAVLLKGREAGFGEKILSNVSAARRQMIREEIAVIGAVPKRDCDNAARDFLVWFRQGRENGDILLATDEDIII